MEALRREHYSEVPQSLRKLSGKGGLLITDVCLELGRALEWDDGVGRCLPRLASWILRPTSPHTHIGVLA